MILPLLGIVFRKR